MIHHTETTVNQTLGDLLNALTAVALHRQWLAEDIETAELNASTWLDMESLTDARQRMAVEMCFVLGGAGARKFKNFKAAVERGDHHQASKELVDSRWHTQAPSRVNALAEQWAEG